MKRSQGHFWDRIFKLSVLVGVPFLGALYFLQHTGERVGRAEVLVPFKVEKAPSLEGLSNFSVNSTEDFFADAPITVVNFWATWCPPCVEEMPAMAELSARLAPLGVRFYFVSVDEDFSKVESYISENIIDLAPEQLLWDPEKSVAFRWGSERFPETYIVNVQGWVLEKVIGFQEWTRPSVLQYFEELAVKYKVTREDKMTMRSIQNNRVRSLLQKLPFLFLPLTAYAQTTSSTAPLIHEDDKRNLRKLQQNIETANKNTTKIEAAIRDEERSLREVKVRVERRERDRNEVRDQLNKAREGLKEVDSVTLKNKDSLKAEQQERERVVKDLENLRTKLKELEKEMARTRDDIVLTNQRLSTRLQNIESFEKALKSSEVELQSLKEREKRLISSLKKEEDIISEMQRDSSTRETKIRGLQRDLDKWRDSLEKEKQKLVEFDGLLKS